MARPEDGDEIVAKQVRVSDIDGEKEVYLRFYVSPDTLSLPRATF